MTNGAKRLLLDLCGLVCCFLPAALVTGQYFPIWRDTVGIWAASGGALSIILLIFMIVVGKYIKTRVKTPSPVFIFLVMYGCFVLIEKVITGLKVITFWGFIGSAVGVLFFAWADKYKSKEI